MFKYKKYSSNILKKHLKEKVISELADKNINIKQLISDNNINTKEENLEKKFHASIFFQNFAKNSFINIIYNDRLIYNESLGKLKIDNVKIKKKEKKFTRNLFSFNLSFCNDLFDKLRYKYNIKTLSLIYNCRLENIYPFRKHLFYKLIGNYLKRNYIYNGIVYYSKRHKKKQHLFNLYSHRNYYDFNEDKIKMWLQINRDRLKKYYFFSNTSFYLKEIKMINKFPYNGCKKRKLKKI